MTLTKPKMIAMAALANRALRDDGHVIDLPPGAGNTAVLITVDHVAAYLAGRTAGLHDATLVVLHDATRDG